MKARTLVRDVLQDIKVLGVGDSLSDEDAQYVLRLLNQWIDGLGLEPMTIRYILRTVYTLVSGAPYATIGSGGQINIAQPNKIDAARLIIDTSADPVTEVPIAVFTPQEWEAINQKDLASPYAQGIYYDKDWVAGLAKIRPWPIPTIATTQLVLYSGQAVTQFADLDTDYDLATGYEWFFRTNLRPAIVDGFGKSLSAEQDKQARESRARVKISNIRPVEASIDPRVPGAGVGGAYNIKTDGFGHS